MLLKIKNHGNSFRTITAGELPTGGVTWVQPWEAFMWLSDCTKKIEIIDEPLEDHIAEPSKMVEKPKAKRKKK